MARATEVACLTKHGGQDEMKLLPEAGEEN